MMHRLKQYSIFKVLRENKKQQLFEFFFYGKSTIVDHFVTSPCERDKKVRRADLQEQREK